MGRLNRADTPGSWHHVMNRGIARRTVFENRVDARFFMACMARAVRRGLIEVHAYCLMTTHFHLLVRSPQGQLGTAMKAITNPYVRWFNRTRKRDGPLFRGRYTSFLIDDLEYQRTVIKYIDSNPVSARVLSSADEYPYGSAGQHCGIRRKPLWLSSDWIAQDLGVEATSVRFGPLYRSRYMSESPRAVGERIGHRQQLALRGRERLQDLVHHNPSSVVNWMRNKALLADGGTVGLMLFSPDCVDATCSRFSTRDFSKVTGNGQDHEWALCIRIGLLRGLSGLSWQAIGARVRRSRLTTSAHYRRHTELLNSNSDYALRVEALVRSIASSTPAEGRPVDIVKAEHSREQTTGMWDTEALPIP